MKKFAAALAVVPLVFGLAGCGSSNSSSSSDSKKVTIGVVGSEKFNKTLQEEAKKQGIDIEYKEFSAYTEPNPALVAGDIDMNRFQHIAYLSNYNVSADKDLQIVGPTVIYPMALFSKKHSSLSDIPQGGEIVIPNDTVNEARALKLLKANGLITFKNADVDAPTIDDVDTSASKVKVTPVDATQTVVGMESADGAVVNNDFLKDAGLKPADALAQDDPKTDPSAIKYVNLFVAQRDKADDETYKKIVEIFHSEPVMKVVQEETRGTAVEVNVSTDELRQSLANEEAKLRAKK
ncbi:MetQ/NlpA family ABC transporter substrate-binding protein [uncultured Rothia sp.]|uniref:MetQ/NlpA family ABC transporter substrate-binding protein n=1 Tax=uncultured Rothia sp. TaxID=316088 RepID=UPI0028E8CA71|nr:MetQ/NlpA family ABC transporter substrate-binding protein [uncultured Rothia sp.]